MCPSPRLQSLSNHLLLLLCPWFMSIPIFSTWIFFNVLMQATCYSKLDLSVTLISSTFAVKRSTGNTSQPKNLSVLKVPWLSAMLTERTLYPLFPFTGLACKITLPPHRHWRLLSIQYLPQAASTYDQPTHKNLSDDRLAL